MLSLSRSRLLGAILTLSLLVPGLALARGRSAPLHVVELFTAQGCSGCPEADKTLKALAERRDVAAVTLPVDYWDYLGWKDTLAQPEFTARQSSYKQRFRLREIYSPQIIVDGRQEGPGADVAKTEAALKGRAPSVVRISLTRRRVRLLGTVPAGGADLWLIRYLPGEQTVQVKAGENKGKTVIQTNVARELQKLGRWRGGAQTFSLPPGGDSNLKSLILIQRPRGGDILGALRF